MSTVIERAQQKWCEGCNRPMAVCPDCGSSDRFRLRSPCSSDQHDPHPWHRGESATFATTLTSEQIEAGARALWEVDWDGESNYGWQPTADAYREKVRAAARAMGFEVAS